MRVLSGQILIVALLTVIGKIGSFLRDLLLSYTFGSGTQTDAFFIASSVPGLAFSGVFATIGLVFLPIYIRDTSTQDGSRNRFTITAFTVYLGIAAFLTLICLFFAAPLTNTIAPDAPEATRELAAVLTRIMALGFVFTGWVGLQNAIQQANKSFIWPIAVPVYNHAAVILGILAAAWTGGDVVIVAAAATLGWVFQSPLQWLLARKFYTIDLRSGLNLDRPVMVRLLLVSAPVFISVSLDQINIILDLFLGSSFGQGAVSHLSFAFRLTILIGGLFSLPISFFFFPYLSDALKDSDHIRTSKLLTYGAGLICVLNIPMLIYAYLQASALVSLLFERGAFTAADAANTAKVLQAYVIGTLFMGLREIFNRVYMADQNTYLLIGFSGLSFICNLASSLYFQRTMGLQGIALGTSIGAAVFVLLQIGYIYIYRPSFLSSQLWVFLGAALAGGAVMACALPVLHDLMQLRPTMQILADIPILGALYLTSVAALFWIYARITGERLWTF